VGKTREQTWQDICDVVTRKVTRQLTEDEAITLAESEVWKTWSDGEVAFFQIHQDKLCVPFTRFHEAVEKALGRPVWTHEFAQTDLLKAELAGMRTAPSMEDIIGMLPPEKTVVVAIGD